MIEEFNGQNAYLSNFYRAPFKATTFFNLGVHDTIEFPTVEHWFQAHKAREWESFAYILSAPTPGEAKRRGRRINPRDDWDQMREDVMRYGLRMKFEQNPDLAQKLMATRDEDLQEGNSWGDMYWGRIRRPEDQVWMGANRLGELLMELRDELAGE